MGTQQSDIQHEIEHQREQIGEKLSGLRERIQSDARQTRNRARDQTSRLARRVATGMAMVASGATLSFGVGYAIGRVVARRR